MYNRLSLHQLDLFCTVVDHGSYVEAAKRLNVTQPALSLQVKALQNALGVSLLVRKGNRLFLTESGRIVYQYGRDILALEDRLRTALQELVNPQESQLAVGSNRAFGFQLDPLIARFTRDVDQHMQISVVYKDTESLYSGVANQLLDLGIVTRDESIPVPPGLEARPLCQDTWRLVSRSDAPWVSDHTSLGRDLFAAAPLIGPVKPSPHWRIVRQLLTRSGVHDNDCTVRLRLQDLESIKQMVLRGLGIAFLPYAAVRGELASGQLCEFNFPDGFHPPLEFLLITREPPQSRPALQRFVDYLYEHSRPPSEEADN
ncbi:MAG: LysR family transcriptional regulator [Alicyclobacillus sp.]|nr:LysR family transcriptional regulator [Alicyclobacillus sp.]